MPTVNKEAPTGILSAFVADLTFGDLPQKVVHEVKRLVLDSTGVALAGLSVDKGKLAVEFARLQGGPPEATILGTGDRVASTGAAFANGETMSALDFDAILVPGHVSPFVIPATLAVAERHKMSGRSFITATAAAHEVAARIGSSLRGFREGKTYAGGRHGSGACVFGAAAGASKMMGFDREQIANCLGLAGGIVPLPAAPKWQTLPYVPMYKYGSAGWMAQCAVSAALLTGCGYLGDAFFLDGEQGFWSMYGSDICRWERITDRLGEEWLTMKASYKQFPAAGLVIPLIEVFARVMEENSLKPEDVERVVVKGEPMGMLPVYRLRRMRTHMDCQFNPFYNVAMAAYKIRLCDWQDQATINDPGIVAFMDKVSFEVNPRFEETRQQEMAEGKPYVTRRPSVAEVVARGKRYTAELEYTKWGPSDIEQFRVPDEDLISKFRINAGKLLPSHKVDQAIDSIFNLDKQDDISGLTLLLSV